MAAGLDHGKGSVDKGRGTGSRDHPLPVWDHFRTVARSAMKSVLP
jgi:hypothetical protein